MRASLIIAFALCCAGCDREVDIAPQSPVVLARVDTAVVTEAEFDESLSQWQVDPAAATPAQWRWRLQLLVDRRLLILEARELGFYDDPRVLREVDLWERSRIIPELLEKGAGDAEPFTEEGLHEFYYGTGANRELLVGRLILDDAGRAAAALKDVSEEIPFARVAESYAAAGFADSIWLNRLAVTDDQLGSLLSRFVGDAEMLSRDGRHLVAVVLDERSVALEERRTLAEQGFERERQRDVNLAYLASLMQKYDVYVDSVALTRVSAGVDDTSRLNSQQRLVRSSLGDWTTGQYLQAIARLPPGQRPLARSVRDLKLHVLRTYAVDQLLAREIEAKGLGPGFARRRETMREQKAIEALWAVKGLSRVDVTEVELRRYFAENRDRYAQLSGSTTPAAVRAKVLQDLKEARAVPLFDEYAAGLRSRYQLRVSVDADQLRAYIARKTGAPLSVIEVNGCDQLSAVDATGRGEMEIRFGGLEGYAYRPGCAAVSAGTIVTFVGDFGAHPLVPGRIDDHHQVIPDDGSPLGSTASGREARFLMAQPGAYGYFCDKHVGEAMVGAIFVE